jgi:hypothetical protein
MSGSSTQIRFVLKSEMKARLFREAKRRAMSAADLLRLYVEEGLDRGFIKTEAPARDLRTGFATVTKDVHVYKSATERAEAAS